MLPCPLLRCGRRPVQVLVQHWGCVLQYERRHFGVSDGVAALRSRREDFLERVLPTGHPNRHRCRPDLRVSVSMLERCRI